MIFREFEFLESLITILNIMDEFSKGVFLSEADTLQSLAGPILLWAVSNSGVRCCLHGASPPNVGDHYGVLYRPFTSFSYTMHDVGEAIRMSGTGKKQNFHQRKAVSTVSQMLRWPPRSPCPDNHTHPSNYPITQTHTHLSATLRSFCRCN